MLLHGFDAEIYGSILKNCCIFLIKEIFIEYSGVGQYGGFVVCLGIW